MTAGFHRARRPRSVLAALVATTVVTGTAGAQTAGLARPWALSLGLEEAYETTPQYSSVDKGGAFVTRLNAVLVRRFPGRRRQFAIDLDGGAALYGSSAYGSQLNWGVGARGTVRPSRKATLGLGLHSAEGYWRNAVPEGGLPPYTRTRSDEANVSFRYRLGGSLEGRLEAQGNRYHFPSGEFEDGSAVLGRGALSRALGPDARAGVVAEWERTRTSGQEFGIERLLANAQARVGRASLSADGGLASYRSLEPGAPAEVTFTWTVGAAARLRRHSFAAHLARRVGQLYGLGAVGVSRSFSLGYGYSVSRRLGFTAGASIERLLAGRYGGGTLPQWQNVGAGFSYRMTRKLTGRVDYSFWRVSGSGAENDGHTVAAGVSRTFSWR